MTKYNYPEIIKWLEQKGKELYGNNFKIFEEDIPVITSLLVYFLKDEITAKTIDIDLDKGLTIGANWMRENVNNEPYALCSRTKE